MDVDMEADASADIVAEPTDFDDHDSAYGDEMSTYTSSATSSIFDYPERFGRTYHAYKSGRYTLPNDDQELERLDVHHHLITTALKGRLNLAPLPNDFAGRAIDLGTGTGIWALDFADTNPSATVLGNDLSPTQPQMVPPNLHFYVDDIEADWTYAEHESFDYIHARFLAGSIADWPKLVQQSFNHTKPGGWVEFHEWDTWLYSQDNTLPADSALMKFHQLTCSGRTMQGYDMKPGASLEKYMRDAGFVNVTAQKVLLPLGSWPKDRFMKEVGIINYVQMLKGFESICLAVLPMLPPQAGGPWSMEEIDVFLAGIRKDAADPKIHSLYDFYVVYGQKPEY